MTGVHSKTRERFYLGEHSMVRPKWKSGKFCGGDLMSKKKLKSEFCKCTVGYTADFCRFSLLQSM